MARSTKKIEITYEDLARITGKSMMTVYKDATDKDREGFDPEDFPSIVRYVARFGTDQTKLMIFRAMTHESGKAARNPRKARGGKRVALKAGQ